MLARTSPLKRAARVGRRAFHDIVQTSELISSHPAVTRAVAYKQEDSSVTHVLAFPNGTTPSIEALREHVYDHGFTGFLKSVTYISRNDLEATAKSLQNNEKRDNLQANHMTAEETERFLALMQLSSDTIELKK